MTRVRFLGILLFTFLMISCSGAAGATPTATLHPLPTPVTVQPLPFQPVNSTGVIRFEQISLAEGLSQSAVNCILQDRQGYLWFGTQDGLNRYDGYHFKIFKPDPQDANSLSDAWITSLYEDRDGYLWIGTSQGGLDKYDPRTGKFTRYIHNPKDGKTLTKGDVQSIIQDNSGVLWIGTSDGLNRFEPATQTFFRFQNDPDNLSSLSSNNVHAIFQDSQGRLWVGTNNGMNLFIPGSASFRHFINNPDDPTSISDAIVYSITEDKQGNLWIGTHNGLNRFDTTTEQFTRFLDKKNFYGQEYKRINVVLIDSRGEIWLGTETGLELFNSATGQSIRYHHHPLVLDSLSADLIYSIYEDREGNLWIGTWGGGANKYDRGQDKFSYYRYDPEKPDGLNDGAVFGLYADVGGIVWVGINGNGLDRLDTTTGQATHYVHDSAKPDSLSDMGVWAILRDNQGTLWVGTSAGLDKLDEKTGAFTHYTANKENPDSITEGKVFSLFEDTDSQLWVGTSNGLDRFEPTTNKFIHYILPKENDTATAPTTRVVDLYEDRDGYLWAATSGQGLYRINRKSGDVQHYQHNIENPNSLAHDKALNILQDEQGIFWISTAGGGLSRFDAAKNAFTNYSERQGLPNNFVYCAIRDQQGFLWLSTNDGISRFDPRTEKFENFTVSDGLQSNEFDQSSCAQAKDGAIYFGGISGLNRFYPGDISPNQYIPPVMLTSLTHDGEPFQSGNLPELIQEITLEWPKNSFEFSFTSLSYAEPQNNEYAYKLENFDNDWNMLGTQHNGRYTNLPGGTYILHLKASNNDGVWNETGKSVKVTVIPPFWQTWWFYAFAVLFVAWTVTVIYRVRVHSVETQKRQLERQVHERTREIEALFEQTKELAIIEERNRLARDLHDSAKQKAFAALAQIGTANGMLNNNVKAAKEHLAEAENLVSDVIQELTFLIQEMYPLALKEKGLATSLREYAFEWENRTDIPVSVKIEGEHRLKLEAEQALYRVVQESLANIARHSHATQATLNVRYNEDHIEVEVADNGRGFTPGDSSNGIGLRLIHERIESIGGRVSIQSEPGKGTHVFINIPIKEEKPTIGETNV